MNQQLTKCKVCKHRQITYKHGILCGITEDKPIFQDSCNKYTFDKNEYDSLVLAQSTSYLKIIDNETPFHEKQARIRLTEKRKEYDSLSLDTIDNTVKVMHSRTINTIIGIGGLIVPFIFYQENNFNQMDYFSIGLSIFFISLSIFCFYKAFFSKPVLILKSEGIMHKNKVLEWNTIICTSFQNERTDKENRTRRVNLVIDQLIGKETIPMGFWNMKEEKIGHYIELFKEKYIKTE